MPKTVWIHKTSLFVKRGLLCQKRPILSKETYFVKRDIFCQKRPILSKDTCFVKGGLLCGYFFFQLFFFQFECLRLYGYIRRLFLSKETRFVQSRLFCKGGLLCRPCVYSRHPDTTKNRMCPLIECVLLHIHLNQCVYSRHPDTTNNNNS